MSYTQHFSGSVPVYGSKQITVGPSESSQTYTVDFSETVYLDFNVTVDTSPFDSAVNGVNNTINVLTGAVVAMDAAQCLAIRKTGEEVSQSLINGFFGTINTELSQQIQALDSAIKAGFGLIQEQGKAVSNQKNVMEGDYNRISSRYVTIFADLDSECRKRIYALDKPAFRISDEVQRKLLTESTSNESAKNLVVMLENPAAQVQIAASGLNARTRAVLAQLCQYIYQEKKFNAQLDSLLANENLAEKESCCLPVVFAEKDVIGGQGTDSEVFLAGQVGGGAKNAIASEVGRYCAGSSSWSAMSESEKEAIGREFSSLAEEEFSGGDGQRVFETLMDLWKKSGILSLSGGEA